ncbi:MAG: methyl-accepting chemotaxis protein [Acidobacteriota bacterium]
MIIPWKLALIIAIMFIPIAAGVALFYSQSSATIADKDAELRALEYIDTLIDLVAFVPQHRGTAQGYLSGDTNQLTILEDLASKVDRTLVSLREIDGRYGAQLESTARLDAIETDWRQLRSDLENLTPAENFPRHTALIVKINELFLHLGNTGKLVGDADPANAYMVDVLIGRVPSVSETFGRLRGLGNGFVAQRAITPDGRVNLEALLARSLPDVEGLQRDLNVAFGLEPVLEAELQPVLEAKQKEVDQFLSYVRTDVLDAVEITLPPRTYFDQGTLAIQSYLDLFADTSRALQERVQVSRAELRRQQFIQLGGALLLTLLAAAVAYLVQRGILRQLGAIGDLFGNVGLGDFEARAEITSSDELGEMAGNLNSMLDNTLNLIQSQEEKDYIQTSIQKLLTEVADVADGDLTVEAEVTADMTGAIADSFNYMIEQLRTIIVDVQDTTLQVSSAASEIQATTEHLASGSESQSEQIVNTSSAIDEMAVSIQQVSDNASAAAEVAGQALDTAQQGNHAVRRTIEGMGGIRQQVQETAKRIKRLGESSQEIGEIVQLIGDIADRTSILALNASIQAAMAGEAGRGFAVVAEEVERLAERSADATKQIEGLIKSIQSETTEAVTAMEETTREVVSGSSVANEAGTSLEQIQDVSNRLAELIGSISMAARQQARGSESVAQAMGEISEVTQQTASGTKQAAVSIRNLVDLADNLRDSVRTFRLPQRAA